uniref:Uncharacterized protein n=1 Tax=Timema genevievae TaxID=629358 RepID=A0A7R9PKI6_TIMGE|nr:unnamed protein product [Timema genevievae]
MENVIQKRKLIEGWDLLSKYLVVEQMARKWPKVMIDVISKELTDQETIDLIYTQNARGLDHRPSGLKQVLISSDGNARSGVFRSFGSVLDVVYSFPRGGDKRRLKGPAGHYYELVVLPQNCSSQHECLFPEQLNEIRKASISRLLCDNGDDIFSMQPKGFQKISHECGTHVVCGTKPIDVASLPSTNHSSPAVGHDDASRQHWLLRSGGLGAVAINFVVHCKRDDLLPVVNLGLWKDHTQHK